MATTGENNINQVIVFSNKPGGMYGCPNLKEKENRIAVTINTASEAIKIALFMFLGSDVILFANILLINQ